MPLAPGDAFAGFAIQRLLGVGGMGEVYLVNHPRLPRREALKILPTTVTADTEFRLRFNREADVAAALWHPHIVAVHDRGEFDGQLWISMDFVEGLDAAALVRDHFPTGVPTPFATEIIDAVAEALDYAHERGLLHRDVKPANILLSDSDPAARGRRILLTDFGIARRMDDASGLTATNMTVGSIAYAAPEQLMGSSLDGRADQYALAATAFHLLTGKAPFDNSNAAVVISSHLSAPPPLLANCRPDLAYLDPVMSRGMAKNPADRFANCHEFAQALGSRVEAAPPVDHATMVTPLAAGYPADQVTQAAHPSVPPSPAAPPPAAAAKSGGRRMWIAAAVLAAVLVVVGGVILIPRLTGTDAGQPSGSEPQTPGAASAEPTSIAAKSTEAAAPLVTAADVSRLLLTDNMLSTVVGARVDTVDTYSAPFDTTGVIEPAKCAGAVLTGSAMVYDHVGYLAMRQVVALPPEGNPSNVFIEQTVVLAPTADIAAQVRANSQRQWENCSGTVVTNSDPHWTTTPQDVQVRGDLIVLDRPVGEYTVPNYRCQHTMGVWSNVIAEALVCDDTDIGEQSQTIVEKILAAAAKA